MAHRIRVLLLLHLMVLLGWAAGAGRVRKKATRTRACLDLPEEILEQMFGRLSVGVMSAFHHALQLEPQDRVNLTCPSTARSQTDSKTRLPVNLLSISPWAYRISYDPSRYPRHIPEAYCLCKGCLTGPGRTARRATSTAALRSTLPPSSSKGRAPASAAATPTPRSTSPSPWDAPACRCWRRRGTARPATRVWREQTPKPERSYRWGRKCEGGRAVELQISSLHKIHYKTNDGFYLQ
ncbi:hypothetical protein L3Q82_017319, partial [Scortum barcoo]